MSKTGARSVKPAEGKNGTNIKPDRNFNDHPEWLKGLLKREFTRMKESGMYWVGVDILHFLQFSKNGCIGETKENALRIYQKFVEEDPNERMLDWQREKRKKAAELFVKNVAVWNWEENEDGTAVLRFRLVKPEGR